jgi:large subunit ribosomal protein L1
MKQPSKRLKKARIAINQKSYSLDEAIGLVKKFATAKFDETIEMHIHLGIDPKKSDQTVRGIMSLPHGTGKKIRIAVFTESSEAEAKSAGADIIGGKILVEEISQGGKLDFDNAIATPDFMRELSHIAKNLGTKGLMPSPKNGTVTTDIKGIITKLKSGQISFRNDDSGTIHQSIGKASFNDAKLKENARVFLQEIKKLRPKGIKGTYIHSIILCSSMGPGVRVEG